MKEITNTRIRRPISSKELERRWSLIRAEMKKQELDAIICQDDNNWMGGYYRYLTDIQAEVSYCKSVFFPVDEDMTIIGCGGLPLPPSPPDWACRGIKEKYCMPYFATGTYTMHLDGDKMVELIKQYGCKRVGLVGIGTMRATFYNNIVQNSKNVEFVDATDIFDYIMAIKSEEELEIIKDCAYVQDLICAAIPTLLRPGKFEYEIRTEIVKMIEDMGSEEQVIMIGSAPMDEFCGQYDTYFQNRQIQKGDQVLIMVETNAAGGLWTEIGRTWCLGEPTENQQRCFNTALESQKRIAEKMRPGVKPGDLLKENNDFMEAHGYPREGRLFAHGQGYQLVQRPFFVPEETMLLQENMNIACHPIAMNDSAYVFCCDNFIVTKEGGQRIHKTPQELIVVNTF